MLTYTELAYFDDMLVDCLIDKIFYWAEIRKVREYKPIRGVRLDVVLDILKEHIINCNHSNVQKAVKQFVEIPSVQTFLGRFQNHSVRQEFEKHVKRYMLIYGLDCGFGIEVTDRYQRRSQRLEACVISRRQFSEGEELKHLTGILVELREEEEEELNASKDKDFSIINSSRRGANCLMLGPARFVNHDCKANARFAPTGMNMNIVAIRSIEVGEEITVTYSNNYFGRNNKECLCLTCEKLQRNGFSRGSLRHEMNDSDKFDSNDKDNNNDNDNDNNDHNGDDADDDDETEQESVFSRSSSTSSTRVSSPAMSGESSLSNSVEPCLLSSALSSSISLTKLNLSNSSASYNHRDNASLKYNQRHFPVQVHRNDNSGLPVESHRTLRIREARPKHVLKRVESPETLLRYYYASDFSLPPSNVLHCDNCNVPFAKVQTIAMKNKRLICRLCPRCNRHAILYNSAWPSVVPQESAIELYKPEFSIESESNSSANTDHSDISDTDNVSFQTKRKVKKRPFAPAVVESQKPQGPRKISEWLKRRLKEDEKKLSTTKNILEYHSSSKKQGRGRPSRQSSTLANNIDCNRKLKLDKKGELKPTRVSSRIIERRLNNELISGPRIRRPSLKLREQSA